VPPYHPDRTVDITSLHRLEAAGFKVMRVVADNLLSFAGHTLDDVIDEDKDWNFRTEQQCVNVAVEKVISDWLRASHVMTWEDFYRMLFIGKEAVAEIENFLSSKCS
jgi:hypothetical protein